MQRGKKKTQVITNFPVPIVLAFQSETGKGRVEKDGELCDEVEERKEKKRERCDLEVREGRRYGRYEWEQEQTWGK